MMEHRWYTRDRAELEVVVYLNGLPVSRSKIQNVSANGAYIGPLAEEIRVSAPIELEFRDSNTYRARRYRVPGQVVRQDPLGAGIQFKQEHTGTREAIFKLFQAVGRESQ